jgi:hypothetical protein
MIVAIVRFPLPSSMSLSDAAELYRQSAPKYQNLPGLLRKHYVFGDGYGGGVYLWASREDAGKLYTDEWRAFIRERYGAEPSITLLDSPVTVDNLAGTVSA